MTRSLLRVACVVAATAALPVSVHGQSFRAERHDIGGEGFFDYLSVDTATNRVFVSRGTHIQVVDAATGKVVGDIGGLPRTHGALIVNATNRGFTTNAGDSTSTMFDLRTLAVLRQVHTGAAGLDGFMYDDATGRVLTIDHSRPNGTVVVMDARTGDVVARLTTSGDAPEAGVSDGRGRVFVNIEDRNAIDVIDDRTWKRVDSWSIAPCNHPTGIAMDRATRRIFSACGDTSVVVDATNGHVVARIANGGGVDGIAFDPADKLLYIPSGADGNVTVVHEDGPDSYRVVATVPTMRGARTIALNPKTHTAYVFTPEFGPPPAGAPTPTAGRGRAPRGPQVAAWLIAIHR
ncbi:MAG TPA: YncE family protein [Gemmatimonadaceae bacterium]|nr:YncE family protein [Gemmatimonadaceae bacterium]